MADATGLEQHYNMTINVRSPHIRLDCMKQIKTIDMIDEECTYKLRYAYVSQRGYYPHGMFRHFYFLFLQFDVVSSLICFLLFVFILTVALGKANQDSYLVCESLLGDDNCHLFGVFDGHGDQGDYCSHYAADKVTQSWQLFACIVIFMICCCSMLVPATFDQRVKEAGWVCQHCYAYTGMLQEGVRQDKCSNESF